MITLPLDVPVDPDQPDAQDWLINELAKPPYQAAKPTFFDQVAQAINEWIQSLQFGSVSGPPAFGMGLVVLLVVAGLVVAFLIFGVPRINRRSSVAGALFGDDDDRDADRIRRDAAAAAARGDHSTAVMEAFRAIARGLAERTLVTTTPGTTARGFATQASRVFTALEPRLGDAAVTFDAVRYLDHEGTEQQYRDLVGLDRDLRAARPALEPISV